MSAADNTAAWELVAKHLGDVRARLERVESRLSVVERLHAVCAADGCQLNRLGENAAEAA